MSDPVETTETPDAADATIDESTIETENESQASKEARYRIRAREAETALAAAQERVERMQRVEVERLAAGGLSHPADLFSLSGNEPADYLTEDGDVDAQKVAADVATILAERPGLRKKSPAFDPSQGVGVPPKSAKPTWGVLLQD